jgi:ferredoxin-NADP reductase
MTTLSTVATADQLFAAAFDVPRDPRSAEYKVGALAALRFRIEGRKITRPYSAGSAADDAYHAGIAEGHAIWRRAQAEAAGVA